jgi:hypothetical protein
MSNGNGVPVMESLTQLQRFFIEILRNLDEGQKEDVLRILEVFKKSSE